MNEHIKTAQAIAELPEEAGYDRWPWAMLNYEGEIFSCYIGEIAEEPDEQFPWLEVQDFSDWSAAKWLERAGCKILNGFQIRMTEEGYEGHEDREYWHLVYKIDPRLRIPNNLDYMKAILAIGQRAFTEGGVWLEAWNRGQDVE
jgi:hypothetical protein